MIEIDALSKDYGQTEAIKNLNLTIEEDRVWDQRGRQEHPLADDRWHPAADFWAYHY
jgi:hypothetical protein